MSKAIEGTTGRKRRRLLKERACDEKTIDSKVRYLKAAAPQDPASESAPAPKLVVLKAMAPSSSDDSEDIQVYNHDAEDRRHD